MTRPWVGIITVSLSITQPTLLLPSDRDERRRRGGRLLPASMTFCKVTDWLLSRPPPAVLLPLIPGPTHEHKVRTHFLISQSYILVFLMVHKCVTVDNKQISRCCAIIPRLSLGYVLADEWRILRRLSRNYCSYIFRWSSGRRTWQGW